MNNSQTKNCSDFENEIYLYQNNELPDERKKYWGDHLLDCKKCKSLLNDLDSIVHIAKDELTDDVLDAKFDRMIENAVRRRKFRIMEFLFPHGTVREKFALSLKLAVVGTLAVIALIISLTSRQPNTVKTISHDLLDWEGATITTQINDMKNTIYVMQEDNWDKQINQLDQTIKRLENKKDKFSFN